jgi:pyruvate dehydrogenase E2 component (dihydrolipoamide acetyltransferase)
MAHIIIMPRQGNTVESCIIVDWKVQEGDSVRADTPICDVETDKATFEVLAGEEGSVLKLLWSVGDDVPVLEPIAVIGMPGEQWEKAVGNARTEVPESGPVSEAVKEDMLVPAQERTRPDDGRIPASPRARNLVGKEGLSLGDIAGSGPGDRIIERDVLGALQSRPGLTAAAKRAIAEGAVFPSAGTGLGGRVSLEDLAGTAQESRQVSNTGFPQLQTGEPGQENIVETPIKGIRKLIADRMLKSLSENAQFTLNASASAVRMREIRERMKNADPSLGLAGITINDLILFAVSRTLPRFPFMNAHKIGDVIKTFESIHLGVAVDTPRGLMVPVIRNAHLLSLRQISAKAKELAGACQNGGIKPEDLSGSTFTVTNLGAMGITSFTPVLNAPEVGILGVCGIELKPRDQQAGVMFEPHIGFSLTINHQVVDGAPAARFLKALGEVVANIDLWLW